MNNAANATKPEITSLVVYGKRWFRKSSGTTYTSVTIYVNGGSGVKLERTNGYGDYYLQLAGEWLASNGWTSPERYSSGGLQPLWQYCQDKKIPLITNVIDVPRKKDL